MSPRDLLRFLCPFCLAAPTFAATPRLDLELGRLEAGPVTLENAAAQLLLDANGGARLHFSASRLALSPEIVIDDLEIRCRRGRLNANAMACIDGLFRAHHAPRGAIDGSVSFSYDFTVRALQIELAPMALGNTVIAARLRYDSSQWAAEFTGRGVDVAPVRDLLRGFGLWPAGISDEAGSFDVAVRASGAPAALGHAEGVLRTRGVAFYGRSSAEDLALEAEFELHRSTTWSLRADVQLLDGAVYLEPGLTVGGLRPGLTLEAADTPIRLGVDVDWEPESRRLRISRLALSHPGVVEAEAVADLVAGTPWRVLSAEASLSAPSAGELYSTYLQPFLLATRFNALESAGALEAALRMEADGLQELDLRFTDVHAYDDSARFSIAGLDGALRITSGDRPVDSTLRWAGIGVYRLNLGPGQLALASRQGEVVVTRWQDVPILDGALRIDSLSIIEAGRPDMTVRLDGTVTPLSVADLTQALDWPVMSGSLAARIDGLVFSHGDLTVGGDIHIGVFGGNVIVRNLRVEDLFGTAPLLEADIDVHDLDLAQLTERFSFGRIEGRIDGRIHDLQLQAWQPIYFEAEFATPPDDRSRHRISQRAVDNLGFIGGGGTGALSGGLLRYFQEYSYGRLGISCRLNNGACELGGVQGTENGFLILTRGGLVPPWIEVRGTGRSIGWHDLVEGLKTITSRPPEIIP